MDKIAIQQQAKEMLKDILGAEISSMDFLNYYNELAYPVKKYLNSLEQANSRLTSKIDITSSALRMVYDSSTKEFKQMIISKYVLAKMDVELTDLLKTGYQIVNYLRESITGEVIKYSIGVEFRGSFYEGYLSEDELLKLVSPSFDKKTNSIKLRLDALSKGAILKAFPQITFKSKIKGDEKHSTLYSSIRSYTGNDNKKYNQGNVYEAYKVMKYNHRDNRIPPAIFDKVEFDQIYMNVIKNNVSYVKGGDLFDEQIKFFGQRYPSLTTINTIRKTLQDFILLVQTFPKDENALKQGLEKMFYTEEQLNKSSEQIAEGIIEISESLIESII